MTIVMTVFVRGYEKREQATKQFLLSLCGNCNKLILATTETRDVSAYPQLVKDNWAKDDLILLEHDIIPTTTEFDGIRNCNHDVCNFSYYIPITNGNKPGYGLLATGLGLSKFSLRFQQHNNVNEVFNTNTFINIDAKVNEYLNSHNMKWHNHGIVEHNHKIEDLKDDHKRKVF